MIILTTARSHKLFLSGQLAGLAMGCKKNLAGGGKVTKHATVSLSYKKPLLLVSVTRILKLVNSVLMYRQNCCHPHTLQRTRHAHPNDRYFRIFFGARRP